MLRRSRALALAAVAALALWPVSHARPADGGPAPKPVVNFDGQIRPILAENCFACHGPDDRQRKAKLCFDVKQIALGHGSVIVPGKAADSELIERISASDPHKRMPPPKTGKRLTAEQVRVNLQGVFCRTKASTSGSIIGRQSRG